MDVRIQNVSSRIRVTDTLLTPEMLQQIVEAVKQALVEEQAQQVERDNDKTINRGASLLR